MKRRPTVHIVMACTNYEGDRPVQAFANVEAAHLFKVALDAHVLKRPISPAQAVDTPENDAEFEAWDRKTKRWLKLHPAGADFAYYDDFAVIELPYAP
ncbi:hypothetical protein [Variovorax gossypii]